MQTLTLVVEASEGVSTLSWINLLLDIADINRSYLVLFSGHTGYTEPARKYAAVVAHDEQTMLEDFKTRASNVVKNCPKVQVLWVRGVTQFF
jgi:hypothetical protein